LVGVEISAKYGRLFATYLIELLKLLALNLNVSEKQSFD
jgi:hypothetical protein